MECYAHNIHDLHPEQRGAFLIDAVAQAIDSVEAREASAEMDRIIAKALHDAKHRFMVEHLRLVDLVPELLVCDDCGLRYI